jgi:hypothetical protein
MPIEIYPDYFLILIRAARPGWRKTPMKVYDEPAEAVTTVIVFSVAATGAPVRIRYDPRRGCPLGPKE